MKISVFGELLLVTRHRGRGLACSRDCGTLCRNNDMDKLMVCQKALNHFFLSTFYVIPAHYSTQLFDQYTDVHCTCTMYYAVLCIFVTYASRYKIGKTTIVHVTEKMQCDLKCHKSYGCSVYGEGKCDTYCVTGYGIDPDTHMCMSEYNFIFVFIYHIMVEEYTTNEVIQGKRKETTKLN